MIDFQAPVTAGTVLVRSAIQSPNYVAGTSGWAVKQDGTVEFSSGVFRGTVTGGSFVGTDFDITPDGAFFYQGPAAHGNLIASIASVAGTDAHNNPYPAGILSQLDGTTGDPFALLRAGELLLGLIGAAGAQDTTHAAVLAVDVNGNLFLNSPTTVGFPDGVVVELSPASAGGVPTVQISGNVNTDAVRLQVIGAVVGGDPTNGVATWKNPAYTTGWADSTTFNGQAGQAPLRFRKGNHDQVIVEGCAVASAGAGASPLTLPTGFRPLGSLSVPPDGTVMIPAMQYDPTSNKVISAMARCDGSGNVTFSTAQGFAAIVAGTQVWLNGAFQLGNIP